MESQLPQIPNYIEDALMSIIHQKNNLVVNTTCNINCVFCSRKFNPFQEKLFQKDYNLIRAEISLFRSNKVIHVNSSISTLTDGEPFLHPRIWDILALIRKRFPYKGLLDLNDKIKITTNGTILTDENLKKLEDLKGILLVHSINSTDVDDYIKLCNTNRKTAEIATSLPKRVKKFDIAYNPSIVAMPKIVGYDGIENTLKSLVEGNFIRSIRVFIATYTKYASKEEQEMLECDRKKLESVIQEIQKNTKTLIVLYPTIVKNITPKLWGLENVGVNSDDEILEIDNEKIFSRSHAINILRRKNKKFNVKIKNSEGIKNITVDSSKIKIESLVELKANHDIMFNPYKIQNIVQDHKKILVLTSESANCLVKAAFKKMQEWLPNTKNYEFYFKIVKNEFYGGNVVSGGLLTVSDFRKVIKEFIEANFKPDLILTTKEPFDVLGRDLRRESVYKLVDEFKVKIYCL